MNGKRATITEGSTMVARPRDAKGRFIKKSAVAPETTPVKVEIGAVRRDDAGNIDAVVITNKPERQKNGVLLVGGGHFNPRAHKEHTVSIELDADETMRLMGKAAAAELELDEISHERDERLEQIRQGAEVREDQEVMELLFGEDIDDDSQQTIGFFKDLDYREDKAREAIKAWAERRVLLSAVQQVAKAVTIVAEPAERENAGMFASFGLLPDGHPQELIDAVVAQANAVREQRVVSVTAEEDPEFWFHSADDYDRLEGIADQKMVREAQMLPLSPRVRKMLLRRLADFINFGKITETDSWNRRKPIEASARRELRTSIPRQLRLVQTGELNGDRIGTQAEYEAAYRRLVELVDMAVGLGMDPKDLDKPHKDDSYEYAPIPREGQLEMLLTKKEKGEGEKPRRLRAVAVEVIGNKIHPVFSDDPRIVAERRQIAEDFEKGHKKARKVTAEEPVSDAAPQQEEEEEVSNQPVAQQATPVNHKEVIARDDESLEELGI